MRCSVLKQFSLAFALSAFAFVACSDDSSDELKKYLEAHMDVDLFVRSQAVNVAVGMWDETSSVPRLGSFRRSNNWRSQLNNV
ncbi:MAG: hypothetical protein SPL21_03940 [Fibrobacter sp.]|nr:hypothetical protein [Fibrobacter sp.]